MCRDEQLVWARNAFSSSLRCEQLGLVSRQHASALTVDVWKAVMLAELAWAYVFVLCGVYLLTLLCVWGLQRA